MLAFFGPAAIPFLFQTQGYSSSHASSLSVTQHVYVSWQKAVWNIAL